MKRALLGMVVVMLALGGTALFASTDEPVTISGEVMCAKCTLKADGAKACQDVLVAKNEDDEEMHYYIAANDVAKEAGHVCRSKRAATVTGTVTEKDGKAWIEPTSIEWAD